MQEVADNCATTGKKLSWIQLCHNVKEIELDLREVCLSFIINFCVIKGKYIYIYTYVLSACILTEG